MVWRIEDQRGATLRQLDGGVEGMNGARFVDFDFEGLVIVASFSLLQL